MSNKDMNGRREARSPTGWLFVLLTLGAIAFGYYEFMRLSLSITRDHFHPSHDFERGLQVLVHVLLGMQLWALGKTMFSPPGDVPPFWVSDKQGFSMTDSTIVRRRYCLMCHVFKPERAHHCSVCNRCVLQMDHHCPWVNNCIGFYNRKFFMLLLFYTLVLLYLFVIARARMAMDAISKLLVRYMKDGLHGSETRTHLRLLSVFFFEFFLSLILTSFFRFHISLALNGSTTIESVEKRSGPSEFNLGQMNNWQVVFGVNPWLWLLPMYGESGKPLGDGVIWLRAMEAEPHNIPVSDTPKVKDGSKKINLGAQEDALFQLRGSTRTPENRLDTVHNHDESELRDLNRASANNSSFLSQSFKG